MARLPVDFKLYLVTDRKLFNGDASFLKGIGAALEAGVRTVQLREKDLPVRELLSLAKDVRSLTASYGARLFVNDRADVALCADADGVHLGQSGIPPYAARRVIGAGRMIGVSTHSEAEAKAAEREGADFIIFGPVFDTPSKRAYGAPVGTALLQTITASVSLPVFAIGGVKPGNLEDIIAAHAHGAALISGILAEEDIRSAAENYVRLIGA